ncbi:MAG: HAD family hydrolase [Roseburia sp.]
MKLLLFDLDGTLLRNDKTISRHTLQLLEKCRKCGYIVGISTARSEGNAAGFVADVKPELLIASGGALVRFHGEIIYKAGFSEEETREIITTALHIGRQEREITVDTVDSHYWNYKVLPQEQDASWGETIYTDYADFREPALKICVELPEDSYAGEIADCVADCDWVKFSDGDWYKFSKKQATKEAALSAIVKKLDASLEDIIAFGDDYADMGMLQMCGKGIAMGNAVAAVKKIADEVIGTNDEDGIAGWLERNLSKAAYEE